MRIVDLAAGVLIGTKYQLVQLIGRGGYAEVWRASRLLDRCDVALKIYRDTERSDKALLREAQLAQAFQHENVVRVYGAGPIDGLFCMEMEFLDGWTLSERISAVAGHPLPALEEVLDWMDQVANGLSYLHGRNQSVTHRDLKLENLILTRDSRVKILDFGQSREEPMKLAPQDFGGTWLYEAPETYRTAGAERDIYAFGVAFYRVLTGRFPRQTLSEVARAVPFPRPCELNSAIPGSLDELLMKCLAGYPAECFANGAELNCAIRSLRAALQQPLTAKVPVHPALAPPGTGTPYDLVEQASASFHKGELEDSFNLLTKALATLSTRPSILVFYAEVCHKLGRNQIARQTYQRIASWHENNGVPVSERKDNLDKLGNLLIQDKDYEAALATFGFLTEHFPDDLWLRFRYGVALGLAAEYQKSIDLLETVRALRPTSAVLHAKIGFAYLQLRNQGQAFQFFNEALMIDEFEPTALYHMARLKAIQGRNDLARKYYERLKEVSGQELNIQDLEQILGL